MSYIEVNRFRYLQPESTVTMYVDPVSQGGVGTDQTEVLVNPGHLSPASPAQAAEESQATTEQESIVEPSYPAGSPHTPLLSPLTETKTLLTLYC